MSGSYDLHGLLERERQPGFGLDHNALTLGDQLHADARGPMPPVAIAEFPVGFTRVWRPSVITL